MGPYGANTGPAHERLRINPPFKFDVWERPWGVCEVLRLPAAILANISHLDFHQFHRQE